MQSKPNTCKEDRMKNFTCNVTCPGEDAKEAEIANLECQLKELELGKLMILI